MCMNNDRTIQRYLTPNRMKRLQWSRGSVLAFGTKVRGFKPPKKILSTPSFGGGVKPSVPCRSFTACKRTLNGVELVISAKLPDISHLPLLGALAWWHAWRRLVAKVGTSNQDRTISLKAAVCSCINKLNKVRRVGRPKLPWKDGVDQDMRILEVKNWKKFALDRDEWAKLLNTLRTGSFKLFKRPFPGFLTILTLWTLN